jgi:hypothetical protein
MQRRGKHASTTIEGLCFLRGLCRGVTLKTIRTTQAVNHVKYLGVIFDKRITWNLHIEMIEIKIFRTFIRIYSLFKTEKLSANIKLMRSVMTYACPAWELATDTYLLKLQRMQSKVLRTIRNSPRCTPVRDLHTSFSLPCVYDIRV